MYEAFFGLNRRPFAPAPQVDLYFPGAAVESARGTLFRCLQRAEGVGMLVGPSGTGKTLLCQMLAAALRGSFDVALLTSGQLKTSRALLQAVLYELGRPYRGMDEGELRLALTDYLTLDAATAGMVLLVDEAHTLPLRMLEEIRLLTNLARGGQPRVRLALAGNHRLEEHFASPKLDSFSQRIAARCYLESLGRDETQAYIHAQITATGGNGAAVFSPEVCQKVYQATDGVPRLVNQVCDHALLLAYANERPRLEPADIEEAWADLQQLPTPWNQQPAEPRASQPSRDIIEFGGLDDSADEEQPAEAAASPAPELRITADDEPTIRTPEPVGQLDEIQQMLGGLEEPFQPAGAIGPEIELSFDDSHGPFGEEFAEEEIISDRYAAARRASRGGPHSAVGDRTHAQRTLSVAAEADDTDMIVVEDGYDDGPESTQCQIMPVRQQQYRQLFAKLRRG